MGVKPQKSPSGELDNREKHWDKPRIRLDFPNLCGSTVLPSDWGGPVSRMASSKAGRGDRDNVSQQSRRCLDILPKRQIPQIRVFLPQKLFPSSFLPSLRSTPAPASLSQLKDDLGRGIL